MPILNALPRRIANASHQVLPFTNDRPLPRPAYMTSPVRTDILHLQEQTPAHDPHSTKEYTLPCPRAPRGPSMVCNEPLARLLRRRDRGGPSYRLFTCCLDAFVNHIEVSSSVGLLLPETGIPMRFQVWRAHLGAHLCTPERNVTLNSTLESLNPSTRTLLTWERASISPRSSTRCRSFGTHQNSPSSGPTPRSK